MAFESSVALEWRAQPPVAEPRGSGKWLLGLLDLVLPQETIDVERHLERVLNGCVDWFDASGASIFLTDTRGAYTLRAKSGIDSRVPADAKIVAGKGIAGACVLTGEPIILRDPELSPKFKGSGILRRKHIGSSMVIPLVTPESGCIGVLNLSRRSADPDFGASDLHLARSVAGFLALSVANARLVERLDGALRDANALRSEVEAILAGVGVAILAFDRRRRLIRWNPEARALFLEEPKAHAPWARCSKILLPGLSSALYAAIRGETASSVVRTKDSEVGIERTWAIVANGTPQGYVAAIHDQTAIDNAQEELGRVRRLAEIGQMAAAIAHDIRNPLTGIRGAAQLIRDDPENASEFSEIIEAEVCKLNSLCEEFLDFSSPLRMRTQPGQLSTPFQRVVSLLTPAFKEKSVRLRWKVRGEEPLIELDRSRIEQVAHNLLRNALEASASGGSVYVEIEGTDVTVRDEGCGMNAATLENLFVPFHTTKPKGTGLGLCNVRRILDAHHATISIASAPGEGTEIRIAFQKELIIDR